MPTPPDAAPDPAVAAPDPLTAGSPPRARDRGAGAVVAALLLVMAVVVAAHWPVLGAQAVSMDDNEFVKNNPLVTRPGWESTARFFREVTRPSTVRGYYLPLSMTSLMVDYALGGRTDDLTAFHRTNLALHAIDTGLLVLLLYRLFGALWPAAIAGLLFGLHPLTVEPVAWVGERKTLLATAFALASMLAYVEWVKRGRARWRVLSVLAFALALLSKPTVTPLPLLLLLLDGWPLRRLGPRAVLEKWPHLALSVASAAITMVSHGRSATVVPTTLDAILQWPLHAAWLLAFYLGKILAPVDLTCVYTPPRPFTLSHPQVALSVAVVVALTVALVLLARRTRGPLMGAAFFVLAIAPTLGLVRYSWVIASDKYVYMPAIGIMVVIAAGLTGLLASPRVASWRPLLAFALVLILGAEAAGVRITLRHWRDTPTLFRHMERFAPDSPGVLNGLALVALAESRDEDAMRYLRTSVELAPGFVDTQYNLGLLLARRGDTKEAIEHLRMAERAHPDDPDIVGVLGVTLGAAGEDEEAARYLRRAIEIRPDFPPALIALGQSRVKAGQPAEGARWLRKAVDLVPGDATLRYELAAALLRSPGGTRESVVELRRVVETRPDWAPPQNTLAWLLATSPDTSLRRPEEAVRIAERAVRLTEGRRPEVLDTHAAALAATGAFPAAVETAERAIRLARAGGADGLAREIEGRLRLYRGRRAYVSPPDEAPAGSS